MEANGVGQIGFGERESGPQESEALFQGIWGDMFSVASSTGVCFLVSPGAWGV